jgi:preprotein translocase subunit SecA
MQIFSLHNAEMERHDRLKWARQQRFGTAREAATEFWQIYRLPVVRIPTHRPCVRRSWPDRWFATEAQRWAAIVAGEAWPNIAPIKSVILTSTSDSNGQSAEMFIVIQ